MTAVPPAQPKPRRWPHIRYSLRTLLLFVLLAGSGMGLWFRWEPWYLARTLSGHHGAIRTISFSPDGQCLVTGCWDRTARIWMVDESMAPVELGGHEDAAGAAFSPNGE